MDTNGTNQDTQPAPSEPSVTPSPVTSPVAAPPVVDQQPVAPSPTPPQKSRKGLIIGLSVGGGLLLLAILAVVIYFAVFYVSKDHYRAAADQAAAAKTSYTKLDSAITAYGDTITDASATDSEVKAEKSDYESAIAAYNNTVKQLSAARAMNDGEAKRLYSAFAAKNREYMDYNDSMAASMPMVRTMAEKCDSDALGDVDSSKLDQLVTQYDAAIKDCKSAVSELTKAPNSDAAKVGKAVEDALTKMHAAVVDMQAAYKAKDEAAFMKAYSKISEISQEFSTSADMQAVKDHNKSLNPSDALTKLQNYLASKA